jgi:rubrerythrin
MLIKQKKKHKVMYETALAALKNNTTNTLPAVFYVCATCGNTYETTAPARCGISMTSKDKFIKIISL